MLSQGFKKKERVITSEPEVIESRLRSEVERPIKAASSREMVLWRDFNLRIPARNCNCNTVGAPKECLLIGADSISFPVCLIDELSTELTSDFVEESTRGFLLLPTIVDTEHKFRRGRN